MFGRVTSNWESSALVCAKCTKKVGGGFGAKGKTPLVKVLRQLMGKGRKAEMGIIPVKCLGICPKNAVTVIDTRRPHEWLIVKAGTSAEIIVAALTAPA